MTVVGVLLPQRRMDLGGILHRPHPPVFLPVAGGEKHLELLLALVAVVDENLLLDSRHTSYDWLRVASAVEPHHTSVLDDEIGLPPTIGLGGAKEGEPFVHLIRNLFAKDFRDRGPAGDRVFLFERLVNSDVPVVTLFVVCGDNDGAHVLHGVEGGPAVVLQGTGDGEGGVVPRTLRPVSGE